MNHISEEVENNAPDITDVWRIAIYVCVNTE